MYLLNRASYCLLYILPIECQKLLHVHCTSITEPPIVHFSFQIVKSQKWFSMLPGGRGHDRFPENTPCCFLHQCCCRLPTVVGVPIVAGSLLLWPPCCCWSQLLLASLQLLVLCCCWFSPVAGSLPFLVLCCCWFPAVVGVLAMSSSLPLLALLLSLMLCFASLLLLIPCCFWCPCCCWFPAVSGLAAIACSLLLLVGPLLFLAPLLFLIPYFWWRPGCCWSLIVVGVSAVGDSLLCLASLL